MTNLSMTATKKCSHSMKASPPDARREHRAAVANAIALGDESGVFRLPDALLVDLIVTQQRAAKALERIADSLERM